MKIISLLLLTCSAHLLICQNSVTIHGRIGNLPSGKIYIRYVKDYMTYDQVVPDSAATNESGEFSMSFPWNKPWPVFFIAGEQSTDLYLAPGDNLEIKADENNFDSTIHYSGKGSAVNNYLAQKALHGSYSQRTKISASKHKNEKEFTVFIDSCYKDNMNFFRKSFAGSTDPGEIAYMNTEEKDLNYLWINDKLRYPGYHRYFNDLKDFEVSDQYYDFLKDVDLDDPKSIASHLYIECLDLYIVNKLSGEQKMDSTLKDPDNYSAAKDRFILKHFTGEVQTMLTAMEAYDLIVHQNNTTLGKQVMERYNSHSKDKTYSGILNDVYSLAAKLAPGNPAPEFTFPDQNGKSISLKDFKGKIVYLDVWASWCGPCLKEVPYAKTLEEEMKSKDIVFLYVSVDDDENAWKKKIAEKEIAGIHLISKGGFESQIAKSYNIKSIPRYIIIGKDGKIINSFAKRPSGKVKEDLDKLVDR
ncbi:MAG: TlpA family protein disulfide reductase [Bacteroidia bacterium]